MKLSMLICLFGGPLLGPLFGPQASALVQDDAMSATFTIKDCVNLPNEFVFDHPVVQSPPSSDPEVERRNRARVDRGEAVAKHCPEIRASIDCTSREASKRRLLVMLRKSRGSERISEGQFKDAVAELYLCSGG